MENKHIIIILTAVIFLLILCFGCFFLNAPQDTANNTTDEVNASVISTDKASSDSESAKYGYCAICGKPLTYSEAHDEITEGKVCFSCASNPDYQEGDGADYANQKLKEAYPEDYADFDF